MAAIDSLEGAASPSGIGREGGAAGQQAQQAEQLRGPQHASEPPPPSPVHLLALPDAALAHILGGLSSAADLARCAAACKALRGLVDTHTWARATRLRAASWGPLIAAGLARAAACCPALAALDLSGLGPLGAAELGALGTLRALRELRLRDCWRLQGTSQEEIGLLLRHHATLTLLDLSGTAVLAGGARPLGALSVCKGLQDLALAGVRPMPPTDFFLALTNMVSLTRLDLSNNPWFEPEDLSHLLTVWELQRMAGLALGDDGAPAAAGAVGGQQAAAAATAGAAAEGAAAAQGLQQAVAAAAAAAAAAAVAATEAAALAAARSGGAPGWPALRWLSFAGCEQLGGFGELLARLPSLTHLDLSNTAACDADVEALADCCHQLGSLDVSGCVRLKGPSLCALSRALAVQEGRLRRLHLSDLPWVRPQHLAQLLGALAEWVSGPAQLDLSHCGGLNDTSLQELLPWGDESRVESGPGAAGWGGGEVGPAVQRAQHAQQPGRRFSRWLHSGGEAQRSGRSGSRSGGEGADAGSWDSRGRGGEASEEATLWGGPLVLEELSVAGSSRLSAGALLQLAVWGGGPVAAQAGIETAEGTGQPGPLQPAQQGPPPARGLGSTGPGPLLARLRLLDVSHCECFRASTPGGREALAALCRGAGAALRTLRLDGCHLAGGLLTVVAEACPAVEELSLVGCKGATDADFQALAAALGGLRALAVGGAWLTWREDAALTGFSRLTSLRIARRSFLTDHQLFPVLSAAPGLRELALASCPALSDAALAAAPPGLMSLQLVCCERITGVSLRHLRRLRSLRLSGCPAMTEAAVQAAALACPQLTLLELPGHVRASCLPVAPPGAASHLCGLKVVGGLADSPGGGRRRWRRSRGGGS